MRIHEVDALLASLFDSAGLDPETGVLVDDGSMTDDVFERIAELEADRDWLALQIAREIKNVRAMAAAVKAEEKALRDRRQILERRDERLAAYLGEHLPEGTKLEDGSATIGWRKSSRVEFHIDEELPDQFVKIEEVRKVDGRGVLAALRAGDQVPGAKLVNSNRVQVR